MARYLPDGELDTSFGVEGKAKFDFTPVGSICCVKDSAYEVALGVDETIVVLGHSGSGNEIGADALFLIPGISNRSPELEIDNTEV